MNSLHYQKLTEVSGRMTAEMLASYLAAYGVEVELIQEAITHYLYVSSVNVVQIFVPNDQVDHARRLMRDFEQSSAAELLDDETAE